MSLIKINRHPSLHDLRIFAAVGVIVFSVLSYTMQLKGSFTASMVLLFAAFFLLFAGLLTPRSLRLIYLGAIYLTFPIGFVLSHLILAAVYVLVFTPVGLTMRILGYDPLRRRREPLRSTYWEPKTTARSPASYLKQH